MRAVHDGSGAEDQRLIPPRTPVADTAAPDRAAFAIGAAVRVIRFPATAVRTAPLSGDALPAGWPGCRRHLRGLTGDG